MRARLVALVVLAAAALLLPQGVARAQGTQPAAAATAAPAGCSGARYHPLTPVRAYDSRQSQPAGIAQTPVAVDLSQQVPAAACAVVVTVTGTVTSAATYVTVYADGSSPQGSTLNLQPGRSSADLATVAVGADRVIDLFNAVGTTALIVDVAGYYSDGATGDVFVPLSPVRVLDTGSQPPLNTSAKAVGPRGSVTLSRSQLRVPADADAVVLNLTAVAGAAATYVAAYPATAPPGAPPTISDLNVNPGETRAALATVQLGSAGLTLYNSAGSIRLVADVQGWYAAGATGTLFQTATPTRVDHSGLGAGAAFDTRFTAADQTTVPAAVFVTLTAAGATAMTLERAYPAPSCAVDDTSCPVPVVSDVNLTRGVDTPNAVAAALSSTGELRVRNDAGTVRDILDVAGYFLARPTGDDVSAHQCSGSTPSQLAAPLPSASFGIVNPTAGDLAFSGTNPCLAAEDAWAHGTGDEAFYLPLADRGTSSAHWTPTTADTPQSCDPTSSTDPGCAFDYGYDQAQDAYAAAQSAAHAAGAPWWLDVEQNGEWQTASGPQSTAQNARVVQGAAAYLTAQHVTVGLYSTAAGWNALIGTPLTSYPEWYADGGRSNAAVVGDCTTPFAGGDVTQVQSGAPAPGAADPSVDVDLRC